MTINELINKDNTFSESAFIAKVDNTYIMLLTAIMTKNIERVHHKISEELFTNYTNIVNNLKNNNQTQLYDELNVKSTNIINITETENEYQIEVELISRYMDYIIDTNTSKLLSGDNTRRVEKTHYLTFTKVKNAKNEGAARKCPGCGANIDANNTGKCSYCGAIYNTENYDWVLTTIKDA